MKTKSVAIFPCTHRPDGSVELHPEGPSLYTSHWSVHQRFENGVLSWETDARNERAAYQAAHALAREAGVEVEPYAWAPTALLTACAYALRTQFGIDLSEAGVESEQQLHERGVISPEMAQAFAADVGKQYGLDRIDV